MECPKFKCEIKSVLRYDYDANKKLCLKGEYLLKKYKVDPIKFDMLKFEKSPKNRSNSEFVCPKCKSIITKYLLK